MTAAKKFSTTEFLLLAKYICYYGLVIVLVFALFIFINYN